jgi:dipeptidyl aminopeptidase/acylaminoacyl peptidase
MASPRLNVPLIPRTDLFGNPARAYAKISPDGRFLSWLAPVDGVLNIWVSPAEAPERAEIVTDDRKRGIRIYGWTYNSGHHLFYLQDTDGNENFHVFVVDPLDRVTRDLTPFDGIRAGIAAISRVRREHLLVHLNRRDPKYFDLYTLDLATGELALVEENSGFASFIVDDHYRAHFATKYRRDGFLDVLRRASDGNWTGWTSFSAEDARNSGPTHLNADGTALFLRDSRGRDTAVLARLELASGTLRVLAADPRADIGGTITDVLTKEPVAYSVNVERPEYVALEPSIQADLDFLAAQDIGDWSITSRTEDDRLWLVTGASDVKPAGAYLYDRQAKTLGKLYDARPELAGAPLMPMRPVTIRSRDGVDLVCYLTRPASAETPGALVLLVHGGPWARDMFGFNPYHQWLANRGYSVLSVNFRGSTGFGKAFVNAGDVEWGRRMDDDLLDAVGWAIATGVADPARIAIMGVSYGGYAVLASMTRNPETYACGVDVVGPSNLETLIATIPPYWEAIRTQLTKAVGDPETEDGLALMRDRSPLYRADRIKRPLLIAQGANDPRVKRAESDQMVGALRANGIPVTYVLYPDEGHGFARPENSISFNAITEAFLARHLGGRVEPITAEEVAASSMQVLEGAAELDLPRPQIDT